MLPFKNLILISETTSVTKYIQISNQVIKLIKSGILSVKTKLPGSRTMSEILGIHRKTVIAAYDELLNQGWIEVIPSKGTYVSSQLPIVQYQSINGSEDQHNTLSDKTIFSYKTKSHLHRSDVSRQNNIIYIDDGIPDTRIAPVTEIAKRYRSVVNKSYFNKYLSYGSIYGNEVLRKELVHYLNETRGLNISIDNILITRGSQMGIYLASQLLFESEDTVIVGMTNYVAADITFKDAGARLLRVSVDDKGINTDEIAKLCKKNAVKAVYITPHHHHPTTVTLSAERRMHLLQLSNEYKFAVIEDDYDYDYHYTHAPILPLASSDHHGSVIYIGALCKIVVPGIRIGYMVAPKSFIEEAAHLRRIIDRQGDPMMELTYAHMIKDGDIQRHSKKALKIYKERRDLFCQILQQELSDYIDFKVPDGGMSVWVTLKNNGDWRMIRDKALQKGLSIEPHEKYNPTRQDHSGIRMGFASLNEEEIRKGLGILTAVLKKIMNWGL